MLNVRDVNKLLMYIMAAEKLQLKSGAVEN